jgi:alginate O-acetyltransferase complex protein AlgJ
MAESREQVAQREVGRTDIAPWLSRALTAIFLVTITIVPAVQTVSDVRSNRVGDRTSATPQFTDAIRLPLVGLRAMSTTQGNPLTRIFTANREVLRSIHSYEDSLEERSRVGQWIRPRLQAPLTRYLGVGNEQVYRGRSQWLFFRPSVDHLTGPGFLEKRQLEKRAASGNEWQTPPQPDPVPAIVEFRDQLAKRGIKLLVVPVPVKASIHPELLSSRYSAGGGAVHNPSWEEFLARLEAAKVRVFDPAPLLLEAAAAHDEPQYLATDTHWTPQAADLVAEYLAKKVRRMAPLSKENRIRYSNREAAVGSSGDLAEMLELPTLYPAQTVYPGVVTKPSGKPWKAGRSAEVLLLGDSFANIYSQEALGWGADAGLAQRLSYHLRRPVDAVIRNDDGAFATRLLLGQEIQHGTDRLRATKVIVWEFTARELSFGDWRSVPLESSTADDQSFFAPQQGTAIVVEGTVAALADVPNPRTAPYPNFIIGMHLVDLTSDAELDGDQAVVFTWAMRKRELTAGADYQIGQRLRLELRPWADVAEELVSVTRGELYEDNLFLQTPCWGEEVEE